MLDRPSQWPDLFKIAAQILSHAEERVGFAPDWSFGGGTALMLQIDHRESHDIDLFISDPQLLPFLNPETQEIPLQRLPDRYDTDGTRALKLAYAELGEIDFICCGHITAAPTIACVIQDRPVAMETAAEIVAKKVFYRGRSFQPRDIFDLAAVTEHFGTEYTIAALQECGKLRCEAALRTVNDANPEFVRSIVGQLMLRDRTRHLVKGARSVAIEVLEASLRSEDPAAAR